jgi:hypothetical protein
VRKFSQALCAGTVTLEDRPWGEQTMSALERIGGGALLPSDGGRLKLLGAYLVEVT